MNINQYAQQLLLATRLFQSGVHVGANQRHGRYGERNRQSIHTEKPAKATKAKNEIVYAVKHDSNGEVKVQGETGCARFWTDMGTGI